MTPRSRSPSAPPWSTPLVNCHPRSDRFTPRAAVRDSQDHSEVQEERWTAGIDVNQLHEIEDQLADDVLNDDAHEGAVPAATNVW